MAACALLFGASSVARAQDPPAALDDGARAILGVDVRAGGLAGEWAALAGARALLEVRPWLRMGGGGHRVLRKVDDAPERTGPDRALSLGYAGGIVEADLPWAPLSAPLSFRALAGAGIATLHDLAVGTTVGSDVIGVLQPELVLRRGILRRAAVEIMVGYLFVFSFDGPGRLVARDLRSATLGAGLRLGPF